MLLTWLDLWFQPSEHSMRLSCPAASWQASLTLHHCLSYNAPPASFWREDRSEGDDSGTLQALSRQHWKLGAAQCDVQM